MQRLFAWGGFLGSCVGVFVLASVELCGCVSLGFLGVERTVEGSSRIPGGAFKALWSWGLGAAQTRKGAALDPRRAVGLFETRFFVR